jgi:hypothetical protein
VEVRPAARFGAGALAQLFNEGFSDYPVPLALERLGAQPVLRQLEMRLAL